MTKGFKKLRRVVIFISYLALIILSIDYLLYLAYKKRVISAYSYYSKAMEFTEETEKYIDKKAWIRLGGFHYDNYPTIKESSFLNFEFAKKDNIKRIGCFGDSFTFGSEVKENYDYPSILQDIFYDNGSEDIEVLNFGYGGLGFDQVYLLWEHLGKKYDLDYVIIGPYSPGASERDLSFNPGYYIKSRFILKDGTIELLDPIGENPSDIIQDYFRFIPHGKYLRYDINPPPFLACLAPKGRRFKMNPFYYYKKNKNDRNELSQEIQRLYRLLFAKMSNAGTRFILGHFRQDIVDLTTGNIQAFTVYNDIGHFPYRTSNGHISPTGNKIIAKEIYNAITGRIGYVLPVLITNDIVSPPKDKYLDAKESKISKYKKLEIEIAGKKIGALVDTRNFVDNMERRDYYGSDDDFSILNERKITSFLILKERGSSILDGLFLPLDFKIKEGVPLVIKIKTALREKDYGTSSTARLCPGLNIARVDLDPDLFRVSAWKGEITFSKEPRSGILSSFKQTKVYLGDKLILHSDLKKTRLLPCVGTFKKVASYGDAMIDVETLEKQGLVYMSLDMNGREIKFPCARWAVKKIERGFKFKKNQPELKISAQ